MLYEDFSFRLFLDSPTQSHKCNKFKKFEMCDLKSDLFYAILIKWLKK